MTDNQRAITILAETGKYFDIPVYDIQQRGRKRECTEARQFAMYLMRLYTNLSLHKIGALFFRDHATVLHSIQVVNDLIEMNGYGETARALRGRIASRLLGGVKIARERRIRYHYRAMRRRSLKRRGILA